MINVEVVYCPAPGVNDLFKVEMPDGATLRSAIEASGVLARRGLVLDALSTGVWGRKQPLDTLLRERDRVEIYRPLQCDPKEARRLRYKQKAGGAAGKKAAASGSPTR